MAATTVKIEPLSGDDDDDEREKEARVVVAIDFGTTFSGFAYAHVADPSDVYSIHEWPDQRRANSKPYCKTQTSLLYSKEDTDFPQWVLQKWGWPAMLSFNTRQQSCDLPLKRKRGNEEFQREGPSSADHALDSLPEGIASGLSFPLPVQMTEDGGSLFTTCFKLNLADSGPRFYSSALIPPGLTTQLLIADYLRSMADIVCKHLQQRFGSQLSKRDIQWCLTVPSIWDEAAKHAMIRCAEIAGLVSSTGSNNEESRTDRSPHPLKLVLEPEAASMYCLKRIRDVCLREGQRFLVADLGGGTIDMVVHTKAYGEGGRVEVREVAKSSGVLGGGAFVDHNFLLLLKKRINCLSSLLEDIPSLLISLLQRWQGIKCAFDGSTTSEELELPGKISRAWRDSTGALNGCGSNTNYDEIVLSGEELKCLFDPEVDKVLQLINQQLFAGLKAILLVGGFSASPYVLKRVKEAFKEKVDIIASPADPGSSIAQGAVMISMSNQFPSSRIAKKTYGIRASREFRLDHDHLSKMFFSDEGISMCQDFFSIFVRKGQEVALNECVGSLYYPLDPKQRIVKCDLYTSMTEGDPKYVTDEGCKKEGGFVMDVPKELGKSAKFMVSMHFGRATIEMSGQCVNIENGDTLGMEPIRFDHFLDVM